MPEFKGGCLCGAVRVAATGKPLRVGVCHCLDCRKHSGSLFHAFAIFPADAVTVQGDTRAYSGSTSTASLTSQSARHFCPQCGSSIFGRSDDEVEISLGALDETDRLTPSYELWTVRRESWLPPFPVEHYPRDRDPTYRTQD